MANTYFQSDLQAHELEDDEEELPRPYNRNGRRVSLAVGTVQLLFETVVGMVQLLPHSVKSWDIWFELLASIAL